MASTQALFDDRSAEAHRGFLCRDRGALSLAFSFVEKPVHCNGLLRTAADKRGSIGIQGGVEQYEA